MNINRRSLLKNAPAALTATAIGAGSAASIDPDLEHEAMVRVQELTGLCLDDIAYWFAGLDLDRMIQNIEGANNESWNSEETHAAVQGLFMGSAMLGSENTLSIQHYMQRQIQRKGDKPTIQRMLGVYTNPPAVVASLG